MAFDNFWDWKLMPAAAQTEKNHRSVIKLAQELLLHVPDRSKIMPAMIHQQIDIIIGQLPELGIGLDRTAVAAELARLFSGWIGKNPAPDGNSESIR
jgi:hypothetical protein